MRQILSLVLTMLLAAPVSAAELKFPYFYAFMMMSGCMQSILECDYTSKTCLRGFRIGSGGVIGDVIDGEDRTTVFGICNAFLATFASISIPAIL